LVVTNASIGIPGVSKMYEAVLINEGTLPLPVTRCDFSDDTASVGTSVAFAVQKWDKKKETWTPIVEYGQKEFCKPVALGMAQPRLTRRWLWPGQKLSTGEEASTAREGFYIGDRGRFVVFTGAPGDYSSSVSTREFIVDQHSQTDIPLRVRH
jgi:hypothetical protein